MNPIPPGNSVTTIPFPIDGVLAVLLIATMATISVIFVMMLWSLFDVSRLDLRTVWPRHAGSADLRRNPSGGTRIDLIRPWPAGRRADDDTKPLRGTTAA